MKLKRVTLKEAAKFVRLHHRHSKPLKRHKFSIGAVDDGELIGILTVDVPSSAYTRYPNFVEIRRVCTKDGKRNAASFLIGHACNACFSMGYTVIVTYTQPHESGASLMASGFDAVRRAKIVARTDNTIKGGLITWMKVKDQAFDPEARSWSRNVLDGTRRFLKDNLKKEGNG
tara:strand:+ start:135 stop:653 length:519 start_codon:yes stop_codon:yes gene_type:complete